MFSLTSSHQYYLYRQPTDMRKGFDGLCGVVQSQMQKDPAGGHVFIFINRKRDRVKLLHWEPGGFVLYYKRLEKGTFELPVIEDQATHLPINWDLLVMITSGISIKNIRKNKRFLPTATGA